MMAKKSNSYLLRFLIVLVALGLIPILRPGLNNEPAQTKTKSQDVITENKITILTDESGRIQLLNKVISFRERNPKVGVVMVLDDRAIPGNGPDISMVNLDAKRYSPLGKCYINENKMNDKMVLAFARTINSK